MISDAELVKLFNRKKYCSKSIRIGTHGDGSVRIKIRACGITFSYVRKVGQKTREVKLGCHKYTAGNREEAISLAEAIVIAEKKSKEPWVQPASIEKRKVREGTLRDLMNAYVDIHLAGAISQHNVRYTVDKHLLQNSMFVELCNKPANQCTQEELTSVLVRMREAGLTSTCNKMHSYMNSAYNWGAKQQTQWLKPSNNNQTFHLASNPMSFISREPSLENYGKKQLCDREIWLLWHHAISAMGELPGRLVRLLLSGCGTRPEHIIRTSWDNVYENNAKYPYIELYSLKGKVTKKIPYLLPLNELAINEIKTLRHQTSNLSKYVFPAKSAGRKIIQDQCMSKDSLTKIARSFNTFCADQYGLMDVGFTFGRIRTSVSTRMHEAKIDVAINRELLFHDQSGVAKKSYDKWQYKEQKLLAARKWGCYLQNIINKPYQDITDRLPEAEFS